MTAAATTRTRTAMAPTAAALTLALLLSLQPATTDVYLPALPALTRDLQASIGSAQLTMSALMLAFGFGQLFWGPVADRIGRRPSLLASLGAFALASVAAALAGSIEWLVAWRVAQGFTLAGAVVCARAMVRDLYEPQEGAQVMALALSWLGLVAICGPALGGVVASWWGWRAALGVVAAFGTITLIHIAWRLPETLALANPHATDLRPMLATWSRIARHPTFRAWTLLTASTYGALFTHLAGSSFIYIDVFGVTPTTYGLWMAGGAASYLAGALTCRRWIPRFGARGTVGRAAFFTLAAGVGIALLAWHRQAAPELMMAATCLHMFSHGFHTPCGQTGTVAAFPRHAGAAAALGGFVLALVAFGIGRWLAFALDGTAWPFAWTVAGFSFLTSILAWTLVQRHGLMPTPAPAPG